MQIFLKKNLPNTQKMVKKSPKYSIFLIQTWISQKLLIWLAPKLACFYFIRRPYFTLNFELQAQYGGPLRRPLFWWKISPKKNLTFLGQNPKKWSINPNRSIGSPKYSFGQCLCKSWRKSAKWFGRYGQSKLPTQNEITASCHFFGFLQYILVFKDQLWVLVFSSAQTLNHPSIPQL